MSRTAVAVDSNLLRQTVLDVEQKNSFENRSKLYIAISEKLALAGVTPSVVAARIKQYGIESMTPVGKRGAGLQAGRRATGGRAAKIPKAGIRALRATVPAQFQKLVDRAEKGSLTAIIKLKCLECVGYERKQAGTDGKPLDLIGDCQLCACPLWLIRPYRRAA